MNADVIRQALLYVIPVIIAITLHEAAHGYVARYFGDDTAAKLGRVTLNPLKHIDPVGTIILPGLLLLTHAGVLFGYAKPVPVKFSALKNPKRDMIWVAAAGPAMNVFLALVSAFALLALVLAGFDSQAWVVQLCLVSIQINLVLALFNLLPLPPLDGGRVMTGLLPLRLAVPYAKIERFGMLIVIALLVLLPALGRQVGIDLDPFNWLIGKPVDALFQGLITGVLVVARALGGIL